LADCDFPRSLLIDRRSRDVQFSWFFLPFRQGFSRSACHCRCLPPRRLKRRLFFFPFPCSLDAQNTPSPLLCVPLPCGWLYVTLGDLFSLSLVVWECSLFFSKFSRRFRLTFPSCPHQLWHASFSVLVNLSSLSSTPPHHSFALFSI